MIPPMHVVLPELEDAVEKRVVSPLLESMDSAELRQLVSALVGTYNRELEDPVIYLERIAERAVEQRENLLETRERSVAAREAVLLRLLEVLRPVLPALLGPVPAETWNTPGQHEQRTDHAVLRGFELLDGKRRGPAGRGNYILSGTSWWIVALAPEDGSTDIIGRYAALEHSGELDEHGHGQQIVDVRLVSVAEAAEQIRDDNFEKLLAAAVRRLKAAASIKQSEIAEDADERAALLHAGLRAMRKKGDVER